MQEKREKFHPAYQASETLLGHPLTNHLEIK